MFHAVKNCTALINKLNILKLLIVGIACIFLSFPLPLFLSHLLSPFPFPSFYFSLLLLHPLLSLPSPLSVPLWHNALKQNLSIYLGLSVKQGYFHMTGKSQTIADFTSPDHPRICQLMKSRNCRHPQIVWGGWRQIREIGSISGFWCIPDFCDGRQSFNFSSGTSAIFLAYYQSSIASILGESGTDVWWFPDISAKCRAVGKQWNPGLSVILST